MSILNYDKNKDKNKSKTLSIKCVQRLKEKFCCVISPHVILTYAYMWIKCVFMMNFIILNIHLYL